MRNWIVRTERRSSSRFETNRHTFSPVFTLDCHVALWEAGLQVWRRGVEDVANTRAWDWLLSHRPPQRFQLPVRPLFLSTTTSASQSPQRPLTCHTQETVVPSTRSLRVSYQRRFTRRPPTFPKKPSCGEYFNWKMEKVLVGTPVTTLRTEATRGEHRGRSELREKYFSTGRLSDSIGPSWGRCAQKTRAESINLHFVCFCWGLLGGKCKKRKKRYIFLTTVVSLER